MSEEKTSETAVSQEEELKTENTENKEPASAEVELFQEMMRAGIMYGHKKSKTNPKFRPFIFANRGGIEIIELGQTLLGLGAAKEFLLEKAKTGKVLIVATQPASREAVAKLAEKFAFPYTKTRWIGGLLTNFKSIYGRIENYRNTKSGLEKGAFEKYTKKERGMITKRLEKMERDYGGFDNMDRLPEAVFIIDPSVKGHSIAVREAKRVGIPVIAIVDTDDNPESVEYPIPGNDHAKSSIEWIIGRILS